MSKSTVDDDEPDYMSDDFLAKCIPEDVRPGLKRVGLNNIEKRLDQFCKGYILNLL